MISGFGAGDGMAVWERAGGSVAGGLKVAACGVAVGAAAVLGACATARTPPSVGVLDVAFVQAGLLDQEGEVVLCLTNRDTKPLRFRSADLRLSVAGRPLAEGRTLQRVDIPGLASAPVPFAARTTLSNLGPQLLATLNAGAVDYAVDGRVRLEGLPISVPVHTTGRLGLDVAARRLRPADGEPSPPPGCGRGDPAAYGAAAAPGARAPSAAFGDAGLAA